ncbi:MAG: hypothetical protein IT435_20115 [Phycisphaerales bacterium]|nr:hypothetical protein [Phycisphaerales bacterium]
MGSESEMVGSLRAGNGITAGRGMKVAAIVALAGLATVVGYATLGGAGQESGTSSAITQTSDRAVVKKTTFHITTKASGELEARNQIEIRSKLESQSTIVELAPEGKTVKAGELLVRLNSDKIEQDILEQTLQVESAKAEQTAADNGYNIQVNENQSNLRQAQSKVTLAQLALDQWEKGDVQTMRLELTLDMEKAKRDFDRLKDKLERSEKLHEQGFLSKNELDLDKIAFTEAEAAIKKADIANEAYEKYKHPEERETKTSALIEAKAEVERVTMNNEIELVSKEAARTNKRKQLAVREEKLKNLQTQLANATITAPSDGLVVHATSMSNGRGGGGDRDGPLMIGRQVYPNELLMILPDTSDMMASVRVQESLAGRIRKGQPAVVTVDAAGGKMFTGAVESTSVLAETGGWRDPNLREYTVKVSLNQMDLEGAGLKPSMRVDAAITLGEVADAVAVPVQAIFNEGQVRYVYIQQGSKFTKSPVKMGRRSDTFAEIAAGAAEGDVVLLREPSPGEVLLQQWDKGKLELAGYTLGEDGQPTLAGNPRGAGGPPGGPSGENIAGNGQGRGGRGGRGQREGANAGGGNGGGGGGGNDRGGPQSATNSSRDGAGKDRAGKDGDSKSAELADRDAAQPATKPTADPASQTPAESLPADQQPASDAGNAGKPAADKSAR